MIKKLLVLLALGQFFTANSQMIENFENGPNVIPISDFRNQNAIAFTTINCDINSQFGNVLNPIITTNSPTQKATIVTNGTNEPILASYSILQNIVPSNGGKYALRLNDVKDGFQDITSYKKEFIPNNSYISFNYLAVFDSNYPGHSLDVQPFFTARLLDENMNIINGTQYCLIAEDTNPLLTNYNNHLFYTANWQCHTLKIPKKFINKKIFIEFIVADCGTGKDRGVVYLDNITNDKKCSIGSISLDNNEYPCPEDKFKVCGTYDIPNDYNLNSIFLEIKQGGLVMNTLDINSLIHFSNGTFCFIVSPNDFPNLTGEFEFNVVAYFMDTNGNSYTLSYESTFDGPDLSCKKCVDIVDFTTWQDNENIYWTELCEGGPYKIELNSDGSCCPEDSAQNNTYSITVNGDSVNKWDLLLGVQDKCFRWRIVLPDGTSTEWCCLTSYPYGSDVNDYYNIGCETYLNPPPSLSNLILYPSPTLGKFTIENSKSSTFNFYDYSGNKVKEITNKKKTKEFDISNLKSGIYIISTEKGEEFKVIKE